MEAIQIFLSYARKDAAQVEKLYQQLSAAGFSPWLDTRHILPGEKWRHSIRNAIRQAHFVLVCLSVNSVNRRGVIQREIKQALDLEQEMLESDIYLIPVRLDDCALPDQLAEYQAVDWFEPHGPQRLIEALRDGARRRPRQTSNGSQPPPRPDDGSQHRSPPKPAPLPDNPFHSAGYITDPKDFFGREELMRQLFEELRKGGNRSLVGEAQIGKSSILSMVCKLGPQRLQLPREAFIYIPMAPLYSEKDFFEKLCDSLQIKACRGYELERALPRKRYILCLDEIEKMKNRRFTPAAREELRGFADGARSPFKLVIASRTPLDQLFRDSPQHTSPLANICPRLDVLPFTAEVSRDFIRKRLEGTGIQFSPEEIEDLVISSGGHPARLRHAAAELFDHYRRQFPR